MDYVIHDLGVENLRVAIVEQALKDYRRATADERAALERFFRSRWFGMLCDLDPELLIFNLRRRFPQ